MHRPDPQSRLEELLALFARAPIKRTFGMELSFDEEHQAILRLPHNPALEHAAHDTHGGILATLLDNAGWFTAAMAYDSRMATVELTVRLLEPARREDLVATGRLVRAGETIAVAEMEVRSATGRLVAKGAGTFMVTGSSYDV